MSSNKIIENFNIFEYAPASLLSGLILLKINKLCLLGMGKRFHEDIVVTIPRRTHALKKTIFLHQFLKSITGISGSTI